MHKSEDYNNTGMEIGACGNDRTARGNHGEEDDVTEKLKKYL